MKLIILNFICLKNNDKKKENNHLHQSCINYLNEMCCWGLKIIASITKAFFKYFYDSNCNSL